MLAVSSSSIQCVGRLLYFLSQRGLSQRIDEMSECTGVGNRVQTTSSPVFARLINDNINDDDTRSRAKLNKENIHCELMAKVKRKAMRMDFFPSAIHFTRQPKRKESVMCGLCLCVTRAHFQRSIHSYAMSQMFEKDFSKNSFRTLLLTTEWRFNRWPV